MVGERRTAVTHRRGDDLRAGRRAGQHQLCGRQRADEARRRQSSCGGEEGAYPYMCRRRGVGGGGSQSGGVPLAGVGRVGASAPPVPAGPFFPSGGRRRASESMPGPPPARAFFFTGGETPPSPPPASL